MIFYVPTFHRRLDTGALFVMEPENCDILWAYDGTGERAELFDGTIINYSGDGWVPGDLVLYTMGCARNTPVGFVVGYRNEPGDAFGTLDVTTVEGYAVSRLQGDESSGIVAVRFTGNVQIPGKIGIKITALKHTTAAIWDGANGEYRVTDQVLADAIVASEGQKITLYLEPL